MPIEVQIEKTHGKNLPVEETQRLCARLRDRADRAAEGATSSASACSATGTIRTRRWTSGTRPTRSARSARSCEKGFIYRGLKPVNWCFDCGSALAEAEVEYEDRADIAIDVGFRCRRRRSREARAGVRLASAAEGPALRGDLDHDAVDDSRQPGAERASGIRPTRSSTTPRGASRPRRRAGRSAASRATGSKDKVVATAPRAPRSSAFAFRHPFYDRASPVYLGDYVTLEHGHRHRALARRPTASTTSSRAAATA